MTLTIDAIIELKSEERGEKSEPNRGKLRPMARSTDAGVEGLRATDSSPSVLPGAPEDEDDLGLYNVPYSEGCWIYIGDQEEIHTWSRPESSTGKLLDWNLLHQSSMHNFILQMMMRLDATPLRASKVRNPNTNFVNVIRQLRIEWYIGSPVWKCINDRRPNRSVRQSKNIRAM